MILYYALTTYHIQCCVLHRLTRKKDDTAVLLLSDIHKNSVAFLDRYKKSGIFDDVLLLKESEVNANIKKNEQKHRSKNSILKSACAEIKRCLPIPQIWQMNCIFVPTTFLLAGMLSKTR